MAVYQPESFYETTIASAITAAQTTISVTTAPNITSGYLVIEANTSNREIIKYTGVSGTSLTGCVRGLAEYGSDDSGGTGKTHAAGVDIANRDVHYYYAQYYDFLTGTSSTGANSMIIGDGNTISASDRMWQVNTSSLSAFWGMSASGQMVVSEDGVTSYVISAGGSGVTAGDGISITAGVVATDLLSTAGLAISANKLKVEYDGDSLKSTSAAELYFDKSVEMSWTGQHTFSAQPIGVNIELLDADEVIAVSSKPKPVKLTSTGRVYMISSATIGATDKFAGFCLTAASAAGTQVRVQTNGIVDGFSGLTPGTEYFAGGEAGEIGTSIGTVELKVGVATEADKVLIEKGSWQYISSDTQTNGTDLTAPSQARFAVITVDMSADQNDSGQGDLVLSKNGKTAGTIKKNDENSGGASERSLNVAFSWSGTTITVADSAEVNSSSYTAYFYR